MANPRDHDAVRAERDGTAPRLEQFACQMCGAVFLLRASFERHRAAEIPSFVETAAAKNLIYELSRKARRRVHPPISRLEIVQAGG